MRPPLQAPTHARTHPPARTSSHTRTALFDRGATDLFQFSGPDVGRLRCATLRVVERGLVGSSW